ncbi:MAG: hypothetical protein M1823_004631 [Watsoniomyces obsoletus]|nr:MAG: hypothetical protein M1823_004631 [Watsoniomyces obsoletus]
MSLNVLSGPNLENRLWQLLNHRDDRRGEIIIAISILFPIATVSVVLRLWARRRHGGRWTMDDYLIMVAMFFAYGLCAAGMLGVRYGLGRHAVVVGWERINHYLKAVFAYELLYFLCLATVKISILEFYRRIFPTFPARVAIFSVLAFVIALIVASVALVIFQCTPVSYFWNRMSQGRCIQQIDAIIGISVPNIVSDVAILVLPMPIIWHLRIPKVHKVALTGVFLLGGFVCVASVVRVTHISRSKSRDPTWTDVDGILWSTVEACLGIVSANLPIMRSLLNRFRWRDSVSVALDEKFGHSLRPSESMARPSNEEEPPVTKQLEYVDDPHAVFYAKPSPGMEKIHQMSNDSSSSSSLEHEHEQMHDTLTETNFFVITPLSALPPDRSRGMSLDSGSTLFGSSPTRDAFAGTSPTREIFPPRMAQAHTRKDSRPRALTKDMISPPYLWHEGSPLPPPKAVRHPREATVRR